MKKIVLLTILLVSVIIPFHSITYADNRHDTLKAAFIRGDNLWMKSGNVERKLTHEGFIRYPKWSHDGEWVAYLKEQRKMDGSIDNGELFLYNIPLNKHIKVTSNVTSNFQWSPQQNKLTFLIESDLFVVNTADPAKPFLINHLADKVENFSWYPNGKELLISTKESPTLHTDIQLSKLSLGMDRQKPIVKPVFTIQVGAKDYYVSTSQFKWSHDRKWISFLLNPTASLSADSNTLCVLSVDGQVFQRIDEMLNHEEWLQWAPNRNALGYISGFGREVLKNKQFKILGVPAFRKERLTPAGYADRDFSWKNNHVLYVSRSPESELVEVKERPLPSIFEISDNQKQVTFPAKNEGDFAPQVHRRQLIWIRTDRAAANIIVAASKDMKEKQWIKNLTMASWYYEKWNWEEVFSLYRG
ncbi:PD40 domain-containing protein [Neobacillus sp. MM2021_6]|uniref:TolB family protein n=1 Tax=Bacillaceae TaxID=186817 RepID=UPI00140A273A|nr:MULTISPECIES: PD40 domain-containing protein [Bacillaceae]MBO0959249.1 PD40 domain-containing protein [Neobacillus sp. MM2021_6]NHC20921.1 translocation protein TolB [Bacillus sp. MM2020_4]